MSELSGRCVCGAVEYVIEKKARMLINCHCDSCRKRNGSAFSTYVVIPKKFLSMSRGLEQVKAYEVKGEGVKHFCSHCGTPLFNDNFKYPDHFMLFFGTLSNAAQLSPKYNLFCDSQLAWTNELSERINLPQSMDAGR